MDKCNKLLISKLLYNDSKIDVLNKVERVKNSEALYIFSYNYNWDNGFEIPRKILDNRYCDLSTALIIFYFSDGVRYLENKHCNSDFSKEWFEFVENLYNDIVSKKFVKGNIKFVPPLNKVQLYKLKKNLNKNELVFIEEFGIIDLNDVKI